MVATVGRSPAGGSTQPCTIGIGLVGGALVTLLAVGRVDLTVPTIRGQLAIRRACSVGAVVLAIVASLARSRLLDAVATVRGQRAARLAAAVGAGIAGHSLVALFAAIEHAVAALDRALRIAFTGRRTVVLSVVAGLSAIDDAVAAESSGLASVRASTRSVGRGRIGRALVAGLAVGNVDRTIATVRSGLAPGGAAVCLGAVHIGVNAIVALLSTIDFAVATIGCQRTVGIATAISTRVVGLAEIAGLVGGHDSVAAYRAAVRLRLREVLERHAEVGSALVALGLEHGDLVDLAYHEAKIEIATLGRAVRRPIVEGAIVLRNGGPIRCIESERPIQSAVQATQVDRQRLVDENPGVVVT